MSEVKKRVRSKKHRNAPSEHSSTKPCGPQLYGTDDGHPKFMDPRFNPACGEIDKIGFVKNYAFIQTHREAEIAQLEKELEDDPSLAFDENFKKRLQSLKDQYKTFDSKITDVEARLKWHHEERERIAEGKRPFWVGKSEMKKIEQKRKFDELKETGKLNSYLKKRNKKLIAKDRKNGI